MAATVAAEVVEQYQRDGAVLLKGVFDQAWVHKIRRGIQTNMQTPSQHNESIVEGSGAYFNDYNNWRRIDEFRDFIYNSAAASIASALMDSPRVAFYHEHVLTKEPGATKKTPWHQDQPYYPIDGDKVCSLWMPVDEVPAETSLRFVAGSHRWPRWFIPRKFATANNYPLLESGAPARPHDRYHDVPEEEIESGKWPILQWPCQPGDVLVFHMRTLHAAAGNTSTSTHRRVFSTRWLGEDAKITTRPWEMSPPVLGGLQSGQSALVGDFPVVYPRA